MLVACNAAARGAATLVAAAAVALAGGRAEAAAPVQGVVEVAGGVELPDGVAAVTWEIENGLLPVAPPRGDPRERMVVMLFGVPAPEGGGMRTIAASEVRLSPPVLPVRAGTTVEIRNDDRMVHSFYTIGGKGGVTRQPQPPGAVRTHTFDKAGIFYLLDEEVPHMRATILVLGEGLFAVPDRAGAFRLDGVPEGEHVLRVWHGDDYLHKQVVKVPAGGLPRLLVRVGAGQSGDGHGAHGPGPGGTGGAAAAAAAAPAAGDAAAGAAQEATAPGREATGAGGTGAGAPAESPR